MREIVTHKTNDCNQALRVTALDTNHVSAGGACTRYSIVQDGTKAVAGGPAAPAFAVYLNFQDGPPKEVGVNGITNEALLAVLIDRLECFQKGPFACEENLNALWHLHEALRALKDRTTKRVVRGVEGTLAP